MKAPRYLTAAVLLLMALAIPVQASFSQEEPEPTLADVAGLGRLTEDQGLWSGPSNNFRVMNRLQAGTLLEIIGQKGEYFQVRVPGGFPCYIHSKYFVVNDKLIGTVTGSRVNLRSLPSTTGDYPIFKVDRGDTLQVWEKKGEWYKVTAPREAYGYVPKTAVAPVRTDPDVLDEVTAQRTRAMEKWQSHVAVIRNDAKARSEEAEVGARFRELEAGAAGGFAGMDLAETRQAYSEVAARTSDEMTRKLSESRMREIDSLLAEKEMQDTLEERERQMRLREEKWRRELREMENRGAGGAAPAPGAAATTAAPQKGRLFTVLGRVDAKGTKIMLRGGKTFNDPLYTIICPDKRFALKDFHGKRIAVKGRVDQMLTGELPRIAVERIEILK